MRSSIATVSISGSLREKLVAIARAGFDGYEIFEPDLVASDMSPEDIRSMSNELGLSIDLYQPFRDFESVSAEQLSINERRARSKFALMNRLGVDTMLVCSNVGTAIADDDDLAASQLQRMAELASEFGVRLAYEALAWGRYVSTYDHAWRIVQAADHDALGVCLDSFHILSRGSSLDAIADIPAEKILYCQLADAPTLSMDVLSWSRHHRLFPGEGDWDMTDFTRRVLDAGYTGPLSLEIFNDAFRQGVPSVTARDAHRSLVTLQDSVRLAGSATASDALPALQRPHGVAYVELQPGEGDDVVRLLSALGFAHRGRHRRKAVDLYECGEARVVLNGALPSPIAEIVAVGLEVDSVTTAAARARALTSPLIGRDTAPDEQTFTAILAPNGIEFAFLERSAETAPWVDEFAGGLRPSDDAVTIDHIALRQSWQRGDEATLFFRSLVGLDIDEGQDLPSQTGLVRSRSLSTPDRAVRLALNVTPGTGHEAGRFHDHIALRVPDIIEAARAARARGLLALPIPQNYYDDLLARLDLSAEFTDRLREYSVLYERDATGEFLHFYTQPVGSLFFEVVQRDGNYDAYGATNAFVRLASQRAADVRGPIA